MLMAMLLFILVSSLATSSLFVSQATHARREKEEQLLFVGDQFRKAMLSYYNTVPPGGAQSMPGSLDDLLADHRFPTPIHHLRRSYLDPMTGRADWKLLVVDGRLVGIASASQLEPLKKTGFARPYEAFVGAGRYSDWVFRLN